MTIDLPIGVDREIVACVCGHLPCEHANGFFSACEYCMDCEDYERSADSVRELLIQSLEDVTSAQLPIELAQQLVGSSTDGWSGNCFAIATALHEGAAVAGTPLGGRVVYGHYRGWIAPSSAFASRRHLGWTHHGWIDLGNGDVIDPTRWVFEDVPPYVYQGPGDEYDEGGNVLRAANARPCPARVDGQPVKALTLSAGAAAWLEKTSAGAADPTAMSAEQRFWLANLPLAALDAHAAEIYTALQAAGDGGLIPIDNRTKIAA